MPGGAPSRNDGLPLNPHFPFGIQTKWGAYGGGGHNSGRGLRRVARRRRSHKKPVLKVIPTLRTLG